MADDNIRVPPFQITPPALTSNGPTKPPPQPQAATPPRRSPERSPAPSHPKDSVRDIVETIVFVIVLVLLLKTFVAEAFVIPTGSMATTLWGYQKDVTCPQCKYNFPVNCSSEVDPQQGHRASRVTRCVCPNCRYEIDFEREGIDPSWHSGDRVLVAKFLFDSGLRVPQRQDVVVFKFPGRPNSTSVDEIGPQRDHVPINYIKRLIGLPNETIGIYYGDIYVALGLHAGGDGTPDQLRAPEYMYRDADTTRLKTDAKRSLNDSSRKFALVRKNPEHILALSRVVFDNEFQAEDLVGKGPGPRWVAEKEGGWQADNAQKPKTFTHAAGQGAISWLRYRHLPRTTDPELITDFMGYNTADALARSGSNWVGDLILDCTAKVESAEGTLVLELSKGVDRFEARFDVKDGKCHLVRINAAGEQVLDSQPSPLNKAGEYRLRFANVDQQLTVWVNDELVFGNGKAYDPPPDLGPTERDLEPARIGVQSGAVTVSKLLLRRDTYYTTDVSGNDASLGPSSWGKPDKWGPLHELPARTYYVQPGQYLCLGDNSPASSDSRAWGTVPEPLMLGRALVIYFPVGRLGLIK